MIGIVGRSGSGKSTLTKLVQRLYSPEQGRVLVDGIDISLIDAAQLRRQIGVVLQEDLLFNRSVRENIAITDPAAPLEAVMHAAQLAGAHEFISELPEGCNAMVGEQGTGLSGGQKQRVAIACALFTNPRVLILDEATSALEYESEAILQPNMGAICKGRTVIIIAHRLKNGNHLELSVTGQTDKLTINSWYASSANQIEEFRLGDGTKVLASEVQGLLSAMAAFTAQSTDAFEGGRAMILPVRQYTDLLTPSALM